MINKTLLSELEPNGLSEILGLDGRSELGKVQLLDSTNQYMVMLFGSLRSLIFIHPTGYVVAGRLYRKNEDGVIEDLSDNAPRDPGPDGKDRVYRDSGNSGEFQYFNDTTFWSDTYNQLILDSIQEDGGPYNYRPIPSEIRLGLDNYDTLFQHNGTMHLLQRTDRELGSNFNYYHISQLDDAQAIVKIYMVAPDKRSQYLPISMVVSTIKIPHPRQPIGYKALTEVINSLKLIPKPKEMIKHRFRVEDRAIIMDGREVLSWKTHHTS